MKGLWKENVGGWNQKDSRRKKQVRNHSIRDNGKALIKKYDYNADVSNPDVFRIETETVLVYKGSRHRSDEIAYKAETFRCLISFPKVDNDGECIVSKYGGLEREYREATVYKDVNRFYYSYYNGDENHLVTKSGETVVKHFKLTKKQARRVEIHDVKPTNRFVTLDSAAVAIARKNEAHVSDCDSDGDFLYGKPLPGWKRSTLWSDGKVRKVCQNMAHRTDRALVREYLTNEDWDTDVKTHACSKTIGWCVS